MDCSFRISTRALSWLACLLAGLASACATGSRVELRSEPSGAEVTTLTGEKLGATPLALEGDALARATRAGRLGVRLSLPGYLQRELLFDVHGRDSHELRLSKLDSVFFSSQFLSGYGPKLNAMTRDLLQIQGLIATSRLGPAEESLKDFQKKYPNIAAAFVMQADISLARGRRAEARGFLARAKALDSEDPVVQRMLSALSGGAKP